MVLDYSEFFIFLWIFKSLLSVSISSSILVMILISLLPNLYRVIYDFNNVKTVEGSYCLLTVVFEP